MNPQRKGWHRKYGNHIYNAQDKVVVVFEAPGKTQAEWDLAFKSADDFLRFDKLDGREMHEMLTAMQCGEMTVSRGVELIDLWLAGNYSNDMLPPVDDGVIGHDEIPLHLINQLRSDLADAQAKIDALMLEYCPEEMTPDHKLNWAKHQRPAEIEVMARMQDMCEQSLDPETFSQWLAVKGVLKTVRKAFRQP